MKQRSKHRATRGRRIVRRIDGLINQLLLIMAVLIFLFGSYAIWDSNQIYSVASNTEYESYKPKMKTEADELAQFDGFEKLQQINPETVGWLHIYGTHIDYPLVQGTDNEKYVTTDSVGEYAPTGSIFLDFRSRPDFSDFNTIIFGHHVENGLMFGDIGKFTDSDYFDEHKYGSIYYKGRERGLELFAILEVDAYDTEIYTPAIEGDGARQNYYRYLINQAKYARDIEIGSQDHIVLLSTCYLDVTNGRHILLGRITERVEENTLQEVKAVPFPFNQLGGRDWQARLEAVPIWVLYALLALSVCLILCLLMIIILILKRRRREEEEDEDDENKENKENKSE